MRKTFTFPMIAALALAACGSDAEDASEAGDALSAEDVADQIGSVKTPIAGQYRTTQELLGIDLPGANAQFLEILRSGFADGAAEESSYCITEEQAANSREEMLASMAESDCTVTRFEVSGDSVDAVMSCASGQGISGDVALNGTMTETSADMVMFFTIPVPQAGDAGIRMRVLSERIGDCS